MGAQGRRDSSRQMCATNAHGCRAKTDDDAAEIEHGEIWSKRVYQMSQDLNQGGHNKNCAGEISVRENA